MLHFIYLFITCTNNLEDASLKTTTTMGYVMVLTNLRKTDFRLEYLFEIGRASRQPLKRSGFVNMGGNRGEG